MLSPLRRWFILALVVWGIIISYIDRGNLAVAGTAIMQDFGIESMQMGLLLSAFFWTYGLFQIPAGFLIDRFGIRICYAIAFTLWSLASAAVAFSHGPNDILASRLVLGLAETIGPLASLAFIRRYFDEQRRGLPTALYIGGQTIGPAIGNLSGGYIVNFIGWRPLFVMTGLGALAWVPLWALFAPPRTAVEPVEASKGESLLELLADPRVWALAGTVFFSSYFWYFVMTWMPGYLVLDRHMPAASMGKLLAIPLFIMAVTNFITGWIVDRIVASTGQLLKIRALCGALGLALASSLLLLNFRSLPVLPVIILSVCGFGLGSANMWTIGQTLASTSVVGRFIAILNTIAQVAGASAPLVTGYTLGPHHDFHFAIWIAGSVPLLAALCFTAFFFGNRNEPA